ncbi:MAG: Hsp20/alpha crystallin family protein [Chloroflexia bacterium]|nr:Hsp20/alpha crystallin family protein [Chloroflexia bacterium]
MSLMKRNEYLPSWSNFFNDFFDKDLLNWSNKHFSDTNTTLPAVNIKEDDNGFEVEMAVPGMTKKDFKINLENNMLCISSEKKTEGEKSDDNYSRKEFSYQSFSRSFSLPESVDDRKINAKYENGILYVSIPKKEEAKPKPPRVIDIS